MDWMTRSSAPNTSSVKSRFEITVFPRAHPALTVGLPSPLFIADHSLFAEGLIWIHLRFILDFKLLHRFFRFDAMFVFMETLEIDIMLPKPSDNPKKGSKAYKELMKRRREKQEYLRFMSTASGQSKAGQVLGKVQDSPGRHLQRKRHRRPRPRRQTPSRTQDRPKPSPGNLRPT